jgi:hypothetical protein
MIAVAIAGITVAGCATEETRRVEGVTPGSGNALAANTVMQVVDPWQYGVQNTNLLVPADRGNSPGASADDNGGPAGETDSATGKTTN